MSASILQLPMPLDAAADAWDAYDRARLALEALYAKPDTTRAERLAAAMDCARLSRRWQALYLRRVA